MMTMTTIGGNFNLHATIFGSLYRHPFSRLSNRPLHQSWKCPLWKN